tara:strand:+ start:44 stop:397 length:354 start_codon:yes stop_codon:yes gene_type:complete
MEVLDRDDIEKKPFKRDKVFILTSLILYQFFFFYRIYESLHNSLIVYTAAFLGAISLIVVPVFLFLTLLRFLKRRNTKHLICIALLGGMLTYQVVFIANEILTFGRGPIPDQLNQQK